MGVSVQSQGPGGKVVTCAHRYQKRHAGSQSVLGRCYFFSQDLTINLSSDLDGGDWKLCEGRYGDTDHEMFGMCQQGVGVTFTKDYHYVVFGAPGAKNWQGIVHVAQQNYTLLERGIYDDGPYEFMETKPVLIPAHSYLGELSTNKTVHLYTCLCLYLTWAALHRQFTVVGCKISQQFCVY
ncbi:hypothetical protein XENOCAPTIV_026120 [Xenoophorus captivus]|uniref:Uncharacterized protein n=1 Tax=Xenoophorus captivus TaxID=1517983 RepID=A0ABV0QWQ1_9TELE